MRELVRKSPTFFAVALLVALALRLLFFFAFPQVTDDSRIYADIARTWLRHGIYGVTAAEGILPTDIRLPGYPAFLAAIFAIFGDNNFRAVLLTQVVFDLGTCLVIADLARRIAGQRSARLAFLLTALCPFLANYAGAVLTETLEVFFTALALDFAVAGLNQLPERRAPAWIACGLSISAGIYLRPDGGLLLVAIGFYLLWLLARSARSLHSGHSFGLNARHALWAITFGGLMITIFALAPLLPWTVRNLRTFHVFQPLTPRYANEPGEFVPTGFNLWVKTWIADYASVEEIYWQEPGAKIDPSLLPSRAFDSESQKTRTVELIDRYSETTDIDEGLNAQFQSLAEDRIHAKPLRYYFWLPALRIADMWLRPRTELLPADVRWWDFSDDRKWMVVSVAFAALNLGYLILALTGLSQWRSVRWTGLLAIFLILRSLFLGTLENPEPRYTLECYPAVIVLAALAMTRWHDSTKI